MSTDKGPPKTGYKHPPVEHQYKKGQTGNGKGRPPKAGRAYLPRQLVRDILAVTEAEMTIRTGKGVKKISTIEALLLRMRQKALDGHGPSLRFLYKLHAEAIAEHNGRFVSEFEFLEMVEDEAVKKPVPPENERFMQNYLNNLRKSTRRT